MRLGLHLPRSLVGRVFALYAASLLSFIGLGLGLYLHYQFTLELENAQQRADALMEVVAPIVADNAVIGDYDTIRQVLARAIHHSDYAAAAFIDVSGGAVRASDAADKTVTPPPWLQGMVAARLYDNNLPINVGGRDYGVLRLSFAADRIAGGLWRQTLYALGLALASLIGGLLVIRLPLKHWLGDLDQIHSFDASLRAGHAQLHRLSANNVPTEFRQTFEVLNQAADNLQVQREQAAVTLEAIGDGVLTLDAGWRVILANPAATRMLGADAGAPIGRYADRLLPELFEASGGRRTWTLLRVRMSMPDGQTRVIDSTLSTIAGADGEAHGYVLAWRDVSEQHMLDERLRTELAARESALTSLRALLEGLLPEAGQRDILSNVDDIAAVSLLISNLVTRLQERGEQLNAIFTLSPDGFASFDAMHDVNYVSPAFTQLTGLAESQVLGLSQMGFAHLLGAQCADGGQVLLDFERLRQTDADSTSGNTHRRHLIELERPTKRVIEIGLREGNGPGVSQLLHLRDVTHETEVDRLKSEFLSTAAHELRTPLASVFGFTELMLTRPMSPERQRDVLSTIHRQTAHVIAIVNELLDLARIEARRGKDFTLAETDLRALTLAVMRDFKAPEGRDAPLADFPPTSFLARVDRGKLTQAIGNVLSNAYKYSPAGGEVRLRLLSRRAHGSEPELVGIEVSDSGIGMTPEQLARVSERFYRADASGNIPGTGLGMSIVKEIVELLGGSISLSSTPGRGTRVTLWLPTVQATEALAA